MTVRISVTYPATDGSMPENVEVEWTLEPGDAVAKDAIVTVLDRLLTAPAGRPSFAVGGTTESKCRRALCGHRRSDHGSLNGDGRMVAAGEGICLECDNPEKCSSFVGGSEEATA